MIIKHVITNAELNSFMDKMREKERNARAEGFKAGIEAGDRLADEVWRRHKSVAAHKAINDYRASIRALKDNGGA